MLTTLGMCVQLWTVCTCVFTNILGLHLALRGPEGSVDRAVRHMAQQNRMVLKKFTIGLLLFLLSVIFFSLSVRSCRTRSHFERMYTVSHVAGYRSTTSTSLL